MTFYTGKIAHHFLTSAVPRTVFAVDPAHCFPSFRADDGQYYRDGGSLSQRAVDFHAIFLPVAQTDTLVNIAQTDAVLAV